MAAEGDAGISVGGISVSEDPTSGVLVISLDSRVEVGRAVDGSAVLTGGSVTGGDASGAGEVHPVRMLKIPRMKNSIHKGCLFRNIVASPVCMT